MLAGMPISRIVLLIATPALLNEPPAGRLNEIVAATRPLWWFTWVDVWLFENEASAASGTMVSAAVLSALPVELPPLLLAMLLVVALACAFEFRELVLVAVPVVVSALGAVTPLTVLPGICVCAVPVALPAAVLKKMWSSAWG